MSCYPYMITTWVLLLAGLAFIATLLQFPWVVVHVNRRGPARTRQIVRDLLADADATAPLIERLTEAAAPVMLKGGVDPRDAVSARWSKAEEKATTKAAIFAWLAEKLGPERGSLAMKVIPKDIMDAAIRAGDRWEGVLEPILDRIVAGQQHAAAAQADPYLSTWSD